MNFWDIWELIAYLTIIIPGLVDMAVRSATERGKKK